MIAVASVLEKICKCNNDVADRMLHGSHVVEKAFVNAGGTCLDDGARLEIASRGLWSPKESGAEMAFFDIRVRDVTPGSRILDNHFTQDYS